MMMLFKLTL